ncbi:MAG: hypothetical protein KAI24_00985 [Planctomycetes bacterium]|nr:hypothetical protein [Planctomycetota bacterium]
MLRTDFVPVAIDQAYQRRQQDAEGTFYRRIAGQSPRNDFERTTQGFYVAAPDGALLLYNNNRHPEKVRRLIREALANYRARGADERTGAPIADGEADPRWSPTPPAGGLVVRTHAKVLGGYEPTEDRWRKLMQQALSRDNLWVRADEHQALVRGELLPSLVHRIARFHLVDNTRGEPPMWRADEVREARLTLRDGRIEGRVRLATADGKRGYDAQLLGFVEVDGDAVTRFEVIALGTFHGEGRYTRRAPKEPFPFAVRLTLADGSDPADAIPPQGSRGWLPGYLR